MKISLLKKVILIISAMLMVGIFISKVQAQSFRSDPCAELQGKWEGTMKLNNRDWFATATGTIDPDTINFNIFATLLPRNDPPIVTSFNLYGRCDNGKLYFRDHRSVFVGTIFGGSIELNNTIANIHLKKAS